MKNSSGPTSVCLQFMLSIFFIWNSRQLRAAAVTGYTHLLWRTQRDTRPGSQKTNGTKAPRADGGGVCRLTVWPWGEKIVSKQSKQPPKRTNHESASEVQRGEVIWHANGQTDGVSPLHSDPEINQDHLSLIQFGSWLDYLSASTSIGMFRRSVLPFTAAINKQNLLNFLLRGESDSSH